MYVTSYIQYFLRTQAIYLTSIYKQQLRGLPLIIMRLQPEQVVCVRTFDFICKNKNQIGAWFPSKFVPEVFFFRESYE